MEKLDLTGKRFGHLTVLGFEGTVTSAAGNPMKLWECQCDCGTVEIKTQSNLMCGHTTYCKQCSYKYHPRKKRKPSKFEIIGGVAYITATKGDIIMIDESDVSVITQYRWRVNQSGYAITDIGGKAVRMHRLIMSAKDDDVVDHISGNTLDNRRCNLRIVSKSQNQMNRRLQSNNKSGVSGVSWCSERNKWVATIRVKSATKSLGRFDSFEDACSARFAAEEKYYGEHSYRKSQEIASRNEGV